MGGGALEAEEDRLMPMERVSAGSAECSPLALPAHAEEGRTLLGEAGSRAFPACCRHPQSGPQMSAQMSASGLDGCGRPWVDAGGSEPKSVWLLEWSWRKFRGMFSDVCLLFRAT